MGANIRLKGAALDTSHPTDPTSVADKAYRRIRTDIIGGRLAPGQRLTLDRMKEGYQASVSTLREILGRLASEGFVVAEGARGFEVRAVTIQELVELASMRELLEAAALRESFRRGDIEWEGRVVAAYHKVSVVERRMSEGHRIEPGEWKRYDCAFHEALISACGSAVLMETHAAIQDRYFRYLTIAAAFRGKVAADEHRRLMDCALARDWRTARKILETHIGACVAQMVSADAITGG